MDGYFLLCCNVKSPQLCSSAKIVQNSGLSYCWGFSLLFHEKVMLHMFFSLKRRVQVHYMSIWTGSWNKSLWALNTIFNASGLLLYIQFVSNISYIFESCHCQKMYLTPLSWQPFRIRVCCKHEFNLSRIKEQDPIAECKVLQKR